MNNGKSPQTSKMKKVMKRLESFLSFKEEDFRKKGDVVSLDDKTFVIPKRLFGGLSRDAIITVCTTVNENRSQPFLLAHEWSDDLREVGHTITGHFVDSSVKSPVSSLVGRYVIANWSQWSPFGLFIARVVDVTEKPFIDLAPCEIPELFLEILFYRNEQGQVIEPEEPISICCDRYMLSLILKDLSETQLQDLKRIMKTEEICEI